ncbi:HlyD family type I secretion periplasmic adaptor subunit [Roseicella aquatilis]|nr:HlyD family type I secretion periplasmic adaptor subunit [Roseicella aquatilis]
MARRRSSLAIEAVPFQDDLEELIATPPPPLLGGVHYLMALLFGLLLMVACLTRVDVVVAGTGRLAADQPPIVLQPLERGVLSELRVRPGDAVIRGQVLALLDQSFTAAERSALLDQRRSLLAQQHRLAAEVAGRDPVPPAWDDPDALRQAMLQAQRRAFRLARVQAFEAEITGAEAAIETIERAGGLLAQQVAIARDVEALRAQLLAGQIGSRLQYLAARTQRLQADQALQQGRDRILELRQVLAAKQAERQAFLGDWQRQLLEEDLRIRGELVRVEEALAKADRRDALTTITAPEDGIVLEVARRSAGSVLREAEPLVTLVPSGVPLIAEVTLRSADIGYAKPGDPVVLKVDAFPYQRHGLLQGTLRAVSRDSFGGRGPSAASGEAAAAEAGGVHRAQVVLQDLQLDNLPPGLGVTPGMTVAAEIKVGTRSVMSYFLYPLLRGFRESIREP